MTRDQLNGGQDAMPATATERELAALVERVRADAARAALATETGVARADEQTHSSTVAVMKHLEGIAEQAVLKQCATIKELIEEARELDGLMMADLARIKSQLRVLLLNGERTTVLAHSIRNALSEMRAEQAAVIEAKTVQ